MAGDPNALRWDGGPGHYEVYYLSATDRASGVGLWIRYTMLAPRPETGEPATCSLWFLAMDPSRPGRPVARKATFAASKLSSERRPFRLAIGDAELTDRGMRGGIEDVAWDLRWEDGGGAYEHVHPLLERARIAKTVLVLPHADLAVSGTVQWEGRTLELDGARGGQAHLWGSKHAARWCWAHCNDFEIEQGERRPGDFLDGVSVFVPRLGREVGPSTPVVARLEGRELLATSPLAVARSESLFTLTSWHMDAHRAGRRIVVDVDARRDDLVGVTYHDPDGETAYCYNTETASMRVQVLERDGHLWRHTDTLVAPRRAHFEYAQRQPVGGMEVHLG